ncbi:DUF6086 family protein [Actinocorallia libanotica]|uniref:Uncharacterized protein n=1 Tax=Actinocorallia libanotica TaxID=46162 RepID=A0ABP4C4N3_9ACTN
MSQYFEAGEETVWNPSNGVGLLFIRSSEALALAVDAPTGITASGADEWVIDMPVFEKFVGELVSRYQQSTHLILRSLMEGFIATSLVLIERGGGSVPLPSTEPCPDAFDVQVSSDGLAPRADPGRLEELRIAHSKAMPI